ncbi:putative importin-5 [Iris pallida]|uniref:Importin-5 n=1 Tax=Iris pallida TaxID=29817 RepID=A0AAX6DH79_IRIPA|nr:putative importin-5 [Iris pallida]
MQLQRPSPDRPVEAKRLRRPAGSDVTHPGRRGRRAVR